MPQVEPDSVSSEIWGASAAWVLVQDTHLSAPGGPRGIVAPSGLHGLGCNQGIPSREGRTVGSAPRGGSMWGQHPRLMPNLSKDHSSLSKVIKARGCLSLMSCRPLRASASPWRQEGMRRGAGGLDPCAGLFVPVSLFPEAEFPCSHTCSCRRCYLFTLSPSHVGTQWASYSTDSWLHNFPTYAVTHHIITLAMCFKKELPTATNPPDPNPSSRSRIQGAGSSLGDPSVQGQGPFLPPKSLPERSATLFLPGAAGARV